MEEEMEEESEIKISVGSMEDAESTYEQTILSYHDLLMRPETPEFDFSKNDRKQLKSQLQRYILEAIKEEDLRKLHQLVDLADAAGLDKVRNGLFVLPTGLDSLTKSIVGLIWSI